MTICMYNKIKKIPIYSYDTMIISDAYTINITNELYRSLNDTYRNVIDDSRVTLQVMVSLLHWSSNRNMFMVQAQNNI